MTATELSLQVIEALSDLGVDFMLIGSFASNCYGIPRSTQDMDVLIDPGTIDFGALAARLPQNLELTGEPALNEVTGRWRYRATCAGSAFTFEFYLLSDDEHDQSRFSRRRTASMLGREIYIPAPEDVIVTKLRWSKRGKRSKDLDDVRNVLSVQQTLDWLYLHHWCDQHGTRDLLEEIRSSLPPSLQV